jgi:hypothetical protein
MRLADLRTLSNSRPTALTIRRTREVHNLRGLDRPTTVLWRAAMSQALQVSPHSFTPIVAYLRISTSRQGRSGLGLEAQGENIARFAAAEGYEVISEYVEIETCAGRPAPGMVAKRNVRSLAPR